ncbi:MAG: hypothetical protein COB42_08775 [Sulfurimonas sp.]|nr:MAG: hypothetical protein COB42_08775 [Sulfurimonas sp.]
MQTIKLELEDNIYQNIVKSGIDIQSKFKEFLFDLVDDSYPAISTKEAKERVAKAVEEYTNGNMKTVSHDDVWAEVDAHAKNKIADSL